MATFIVHLIAWFVTFQPVTEWLICRAKKRPYIHIMSSDGKDVYMERYWLFNPYPTPEQNAAWKASGKRPWRFPISIRLHRIRREDLDPHHHDHPWNCHSIILRGWYTELREEQFSAPNNLFTTLTMRYLRSAGDVVRIDHNQFHKIAYVAEEGAWTLFITGKKRHTWGFNVDGQKVPFREYLGL